MKIKNIILSICASISLTNICAGQSFETLYLLWDKNPEPDVTGYKVYRQVLGTNTLLRTVNTNLATITTNDLVLYRTNFFYVTAINPAIESAPSTNVNWYVTIPPAAPVSIVITNKLPPPN